MYSASDDAVSIRPDVSGQQETGERYNALSPVYDGYSFVCDMLNLFIADNVVKRPDPLSAALKHIHHKQD